MAEVLRVLIVEDYESDALLVEQSIRRAGWDVRSRRVDDEHSFRAALGEPWDVIVSDYSLPGFGGDMALRILNESGQDIPFIIVSGSVGEKAAVEMMRAGARDYILKGDLVWLAPAIQRELRDAEERKNRRAAESALQASERRYRKLFERNLAGVCQTAADGTILDCNDAFAIVLGARSREDMLSRNLLEFYHDPGLREQVVERLIANGSVTSFEIQMERVDGAPAWVVVNLTRVTEPGGAAFEGTMIDITERKRAEQEIRRNEQRYRHLFERNLAGVYQTALDGTILDCNDAFARIFGAPSREEMLGHSVLEFYAQASERRRLVEQLRNEGFMRNVELLLNRLDGTPVWILMNVALVDGPDGTQHLEGTLTDISDRKRAEDNLRASERKFRDLFERNLAGVYQTALDGTILDCNLAFARIFGCETREEMLHHNMHEFYPKGAMRAEFIDLLQGKGAVTNLELEMRRVDGYPISILENVTLVEDADGSRHLEGTITDISKRKVAEYDLRRTANYLRQLLESTGDGVFTIDSEGHCELVNAAASEMLGYAAGDFVGRKLHDVIHVGLEGAELESHVCPILKTLKDGRERRGADETFRRSDGRSIEIEYCASPIFDEGATRGAVVTFRNVTERHQLESQLERMKRLDSLGKLAGTMAHEFNNVMMAISPWGEVLRRKAVDDPMIQKASTHILDAIQRGKGITSEILRFTRPTTVTLRPVDLVEVFDKLGQQAQSLIGQRHQVDVSMPVEPLVISADGEQLSQVIVNLLVNARDAMPKGGTIHLRLERCMSPEENCVGDQCARIVVEDTGEGIPRDVLPRIFEPMFTTKRNGTGLGLFLAHQVIRRHEGKVSVESNPGVGTTFTISIPIAQGSVKPAS